MQARWTPSCWSPTSRGLSSAHVPPGVDLDLWPALPRLQQHLRIHHLKLPPGRRYLCVPVFAQHQHEELSEEHVEGGSESADQPKNHHCRLVGVLGGGFVFCKIPHCSLTSVHGMVLLYSRFHIFSTIECIQTSQELQMLCLVSTNHRCCHGERRSHLSDRRHCNT